jgi:hypothetical protein
MARPKANRRKNDPLAAKKDSVDFRDWIYEPVLVPLKESLLPKKPWMEILDQGQEGACTGFGLGTVINYLIRARGEGAKVLVSTRMLYEMAKHHDKWPGESYEGSSARGAMKGWYKNGVCPEGMWPYVIDDPGKLSDQARKSALEYPLGAYYRVLPKRSDLHAALHEVPAVFITAATHKGWDKPEDGVISYDSRWTEQGGHAFAIVGYTPDGFLIQNSWGEDWGGVTIGRTTYPGCAIWTYEDFDHNMWDAWAAQMGRPFESLEALRWSTGQRAEYARNENPSEKPPPRASIRDHFIHIDDGYFDPYGEYYSTVAEVGEVLSRAVYGRAKHIVFYAHGGVNSVKDAARRVHAWRPAFERNRIHEIHFLWETGLGEELRDLILGKQELVESRAAGVRDWVDNWIECFTGPLGRGLWSEMQTDAEIAFRDEEMAGSKVIEMLTELMRAVPADKRPKLHLVGHSAGSIFLGHLLTRWTANGGADIEFENLILFAPACTHEFFHDRIKPALETRTVKNLSHFLLDDKAERDDTVSLYGKSLLYLVSRSYQQKGVEVPLMGMEKYLKKLPVSGIPKTRINHFTPADKPDWTQSTSHGGFDNDLPTMNSALRLILGTQKFSKFRKEEIQGY